MKGFAKEFKEFINRGNLIDIAAAFVIGAAFVALTKSFINAVLMPIIAIPFGKPSFDDVLIITINDAKIYLGSFISEVVNFILIALAVFLVIKMYNAVTRRDTTPGATEVDLLTEIRDELRASRGQG
ncbi:MAG TPA: large conductance mechanosensitive channel protein MscL [Acidimicrobiales bacterium]